MSTRLKYFQHTLKTAIVTKPAQNQPPISTGIHPPAITRK